MTTRLNPIPKTEEVLIQKIEEGATSSTSVILDFYLNVFRTLLPTALFSLIFIYQVKKELTLFILIGYLFVIIISNFILKKLYNLKEKILVNSEFLNRHLVNGLMELVVFRTNKKYNLEIEITFLASETSEEYPLKIISFFLFL